MAGNWMSGQQEPPERKALRERAAAVRDGLERERRLSDEAWLRKWAIEHLLTAERGASIMEPGWVVQEQGLADLKPGQIMSMHDVPVLKVTRIAPPLFGLADEIVAYVLSGEHPVPDEDGTS